MTTKLAANTMQFTSPMSNSDCAQHKNCRR